MIAIIKGGLYTTVQDLGRFGYRNMGVPVSGAMDAVSAFLANALVGNSKNEAVLEITLMGPTLQFEQATKIAIAGAPFEVLLNAVKVAPNQSISVKKDDVLKIGKAQKGMRCYLAVGGGFQTPIRLKSRSFYAPITEEVKLKHGAMLPIKSLSEVECLELPATPLKFETKHVEVYPGPEFTRLTKFQQTLLAETEFKVSAQSNRMAYLFEGGDQLSAKEILTAPVQPGTVQLTPSGKIVVLMRDAQVTGGYARIFQLTETSLSILSQKRGGEAVGFKLK